MIIRALRRWLLPLDRKRHHETHCFVQNLIFDATTMTPLSSSESFEDAESPHWWVVRIPAHCARQWPTEAG